MSGRKGRTAPEWITFAVSCTVLAIVAGALVVQLTETRTPPAPAATVSGSARQVGDAYFVDVSVRNDGHETAANVQVTAQLTVGDETTDADQTIDFLAGQESHELVFAFDQDPADGDLQVAVVSFAVP